MPSFLRRRRLRHCPDEPRRLLRLLLEAVRGAGRRRGVVALGRRRALAVSRRCLDAVPLRALHRDPRKSHLRRAERNGGARFLVDTRVRSRPGLRHSPSRRRLEAGADRRGDRCRSSWCPRHALRRSAVGGDRRCSSDERLRSRGLSCGGDADDRGDGRRIPHGRRRRACARRQEHHRIDVPLLITCGAQTEVDVRLGELGHAARADGSHDRAFVDGRAALHTDRAEVNECGGVPVRRLDRNGLPARRHRSRERDDSPGRSEHLGTAGGAEIDAAVLTAREGMRMIERERPQNRSVDRPGPRTRRRHRERARTREQDSKTPHRFPPCCQF